MEVFVTLDPHSNFIREIASKRSVKGIRFNTSAAMKESPKHLLERLEEEVYPKELWVDLKCRQLRVTKDAIIPPDNLHISHRIRVDTPTDMWFKSLKRNDNNRITEETYRSLKVTDVSGWGAVKGGNRLKLRTPRGVEVRFGSGAAISILDPSLQIYGYLTKRDKNFIDAAVDLGIHRYMLSFVEEESDIRDVLNRDPEAQIMAKIESNKGLQFVDTVFPKYKDNVRLMLARGDLYMWLDRPHHILNASRKIIQADDRAVAASRLFESLNYVNLKKDPPGCADITDMAYLKELGYESFLLGDAICYDKKRLEIAIGIMEAINHDYR